MDVFEIEGKVKQAHLAVLDSLVDHLKAVGMLKEWFLNTRIDKEQSNMQAAQVLLNSVKCVCVKTEVRTWPTFSARVEVRPASSADDAGNGAGCLVVIDFMEMLKNDIPVS